MGALALCALIPAMATQRAPSPRVIVVSLDGAKPAVLKDLVQRGRLPALKGMMDSGCWTWNAQTILPSSTLPSHISMLTGLSPEAHGVTWNSEKPEKGPLKVETIFSVAKKEGLRTAMVVGKPKLRLLDKPGTLDADVLEEGDARAVARAARQVLRLTNPDLLFVHFGQADEAGHDWGWGDERDGTPSSPQYQKALEACDRALGMLRREIEGKRHRGNTLIILTADHGGVGKNHGGDDPQETTIPWIACGDLVALRGELKVPVKTEDTAATALAALGIPVPSGWAGTPVPCLRPPGANALRPAA
jgi:predicted AlkP superfamily pyrophosphatase or phosphodiesterase